MNQRYAAYNLVEILSSLAVLGLLIGMSIALIRPDESETALAKKVDTYVTHLSNVYERLVAQYGVTPTQIDLNNDGDRSNDANGVPNFLKNYDTMASFWSGTTNGNTTSYLQYPGNIRVWLYPNQITALSTKLSVLTALGFSDKEFLLIEVLPGGTISALPKTTSGVQANSDLVLLHIDEQTGHIETAYELAQRKATALGANVSDYEKTFYDHYKND
ncbi:MAG: hypothetical protein HEQ32_06500 [Vampirovibrio sp.]